LRLIHSGTIFAGKPSVGSWVVYGLGSMRSELPAYVRASDPGGLPTTEPKNWSAGFLRPFTRGRSSAPPLAGARPATAARDDARRARRQLEFVRSLKTWSHLQRHPENSELQARIAKYELAARMQTAVPERSTLLPNRARRKILYGLHDQTTAEYGKRCLSARRLVERGVRFVQVF